MAADKSNKSVSFARWQQGAGFVVPRTTVCFFSLPINFAEMWLVNGMYNGTFHKDRLIISWL